MLTVQPNEYDATDARDRLPRGKFGTGGSSSATMEKYLSVIGPVMEGLPKPYHYNR